MQDHGGSWVTTSHTYRVNTLTHPRNPFYQQQLLLGVYGVHAQTILNPFMQNKGPDIFQHDNARPHTMRITTQFLAQNNVNALTWPALSPVMNLIEHVWDELGRIPNMLIQRYVNSMRRRIQLCICKNVGHTSY